MKHFAFIAGLLFWFGLMPVFGSVGYFEADAKRIQDFPFGLEIHSKWLSDGQVQFDVVIKEQRVKFSRGMRVELVRLAAAEWSEGVRLIPFDRHESTITCSFSVTPAELRDEHLAFAFTIVPEDMMPHAHVYFFRPRNFLPKATIAASPVEAK